jgi:hypothetical protein
MGVEPIDQLAESGESSSHVVASVKAAHILPTLPAGNDGTWQGNAGGSPAPA